MKMLFIKLIRDIKKSLGQFITVVIVSTIGIVLFSGMAVSNSSLLKTAENYYSETNMEDLSASYLGIDDMGVQKIKEINGVKDAYGRLNLKADANDSQSRFFVNTVSNDQKINIPIMNKGHIPDTNTECMIDSAYAKANNLNTSDKMSVTINQKKYNLNISGIFDTSEHIYLIEDPTKSMLPDHKNFGLLYVNRSMVNELTGNSKYNEVLVTLDNSKNSDSVGKEIEKITGNYGFGHITNKKDLLSYSQLQSDIDQGDSFAKVFPIIFFLVSSAILFISMSRTIQLERNQIGIMKALGISNYKILFHYISYALFTSVIGSVLGNVIGIVFLPKLMFNTYDMLYVFPKIEYVSIGRNMFVSTVVLMLFSLGASLIASRKTLKEVPAQCMRPVPPKKVHKTWIEKRKKLWEKISYKNKLIIRNIFLNKKRAVISSVGIIGSVGVLVCAFAMKDLFTNFVNMQFNKMQQFDSMVMLSTPVKYDAPSPFNNDNISSVDKFSIVDVTMHFRKNVSSVLYMLPKDNQVIDLFDQDDHKIVLPDDGIVVPLKRAQEYNIKVGDTITVKLESPFYKNQDIHVKVAAIDVLYSSQDLYVSMDYMKSLNIDPIVLGYYVKMKDTSKETDTNHYISGVQNVKSIVVKSQLKDQLKTMFKLLNTTVYIFLVMSACLSLAVIFNISSINIFERRRDIATLKVLGYHKKEINSLVNVENLFITGFGCIFGLVFGIFFYRTMLVSAINDDQYFPATINAGAMLLSVVMAFVFTLFANFMLRGKTHKIDMVESLKSVE